MKSGKIKIKIGDIYFDINELVIRSENVDDNLLREYF